MISQIVCEWHTSTRSQDCYATRFRSSRNSFQMTSLDDLTAWDKRRRPSEQLNAIVAVNLARLTNTPSILPAALYSCCQLSVDELLEGYTRPDGVTESLSTEDLRRCFKGKVQLCMQYMKRMDDVLDTLIEYDPEIEEGCTQSSNRMAGKKCQHAIKHMWHQWVFRMGDKDDCCCDALIPWEKIFPRHRRKQQSDERRLYPQCAETLQIRDAGDRENLWWRLSSILELE